MAYNNWNEVGEDIQDLVDTAIRSGNFTNLSRSLGNMINETIDTFVGQRPYQQNPYGHGSTYGQHGSFENSHAKQSQPSQSAYRTSRGAQLPMLYNPHPSGRFFSVLEAGCGVLGFLFFGLCILFSFWVGALLAISLFFAFLTMGSLWLVVRGIKRLQLQDRFSRYINLIGQQIYVPLRDLANTTGKSISYTVRDLQKMISDRMFYEAHIDQKEGYLILSDQAYSDYQRARADYYAKQEAQKRKDAEKKRQEGFLSAEVQQLIADGQEHIAHIHHCNDLIPDAAFSEKLDRMEQIVIRIFDEVKRHPEVAPDLSKMMTYYLPTTAKLLNAYCELDQQPSAGENVTRTKKEIEDAVETLNVAFEKLLDDLFTERAWDISSDISVLNTMLAQEGLKEKDFK